ATLNSNPIIRVTGAYTPLFGGLASGIRPTRYGDVTTSDDIYVVYSACNYKDSSQTIYFSSDTACDAYRINVPVSLKPAIASEQFKIYPNPAQDRLHIEREQATKNATIKIVNLLGSELLRDKVQQQEHSVDIS